VLLLELILDGMSDDGGEVGCEDSGMKVLKKRKGRFSGEVYDFNAAFDRFVGASNSSRYGVSWSSSSMLCAGSTAYTAAWRWSGFPAPRERTI